jgi:hypothetical protein
VSKPGPNLREVGRRPGRERDPEGKAALFSNAAPAPAKAAGPGTVVVECSTCGASTPLSYADFVRANLPIAVWLPPVGIRFNHRMICPACHQRTWLQAHWWS